MLGTRQLGVVIFVESAHGLPEHEAYLEEKRTWRITAANDFEVLERSEICELGRKGRGDSREGQLSTGHQDGFQPRI